MRMRCMCVCRSVCDANVSHFVVKQKLREGNMGEDGKEVVREVEIGDRMEEGLMIVPRGRRLLDFFLEI